MAKPASDLCAERALHYLQLGGLLFSDLDELVMFPEDVLPLARGEQTEVSENHMTCTTAQTRAPGYCMERSCN